MGRQEKILQLKKLSVVLPLVNGDLHAVRDVSLELAQGETLGIVGESGSGKSMTALATTEPAAEKSAPQCRADKA